MSQPQSPTGTKPAPTKAPEEEAGPSSLSATEKENLHPLTGGRLRSSNTVGLKRKSSVLATKLHNPPNTKDSKQAPSLVPSKKRKVTSSSDGEIEQSRPRARRLKPATRGDVLRNWQALLKRKTNVSLADCHNPMSTPAVTI
jgi:hypothetical protein